MEGKVDYCSHEEHLEHHAFLRKELAMDCVMEVPKLHDTLKAVKELLHLIAIGVLGLLILGFIHTGTVKAETYVYEGEYVVYAQGDFCAYREGVKGCAYTLPAGVHKFVPSEDGRTLIPESLSATTKTERKLVPFEFGAEFDACNSVADGVSTTCSHNIFFKADSDPDTRKQWHLPAIKAQEAWKIKDNKDCVIAVLDTGVDCNHPDLKDACILGYDAIRNVDNWMGTDVNGHGTHVAGTAASIRGNGIGGTGVSRCSIVPVKVLGDSGGGSLYSVMRGVEYVRRNKGSFGTNHVYINMSLGSSGYSSGFDSAVQQVLKSGVTVVAAAGNEGTNNDTRPHYPSNFKGVLSVGATDSRGRRASFSNYGKSVDITAPGVGIYATWPGGGYHAISGTSMATPIVTAALALTERKDSSGSLDLLRLLKKEGEDETPAEPEEPVDKPQCRDRRLKKCYVGRCKRYRLYRRMAAWRACRKSCQSYWCK